jgi:hypothetical protein
MQPVNIAALADSLTKDGFSVSVSGNVLCGLIPVYVAPPDVASELPVRIQLFVNPPAVTLRVAATLNGNRAIEIELRQNNNMGATHAEIAAGVFLAANILAEAWRGANRREFNRT